MEQKKQMTFTLPKLDAFDIISILLWVTLLVPSLQLPSNATYSFVRSILFILWVAAFLIFVSVKIFKEKRMLFYSATIGNAVVALFGFSTILSLVLSASRIDSMYGFDLTFASSALVLLAIIVVYFVLKLAGLSLELAVSRVLSVLPFSLVLIDILSIAAYLLPASVYTKVFGTYAQYFSHLVTSPIALLGTIQSAVVIHVVALIVVLFQLSTAIKGIKIFSFEITKRVLLALVITIMSSLLIFASYGSSIMAIIIALLALGIISYLLYNYAPKQRTSFVIAAIAVIIIGGLLGFIWNKMGIVGKTQTANIDADTTGQVIQQSFLNASTPMWRQVTGFGVGTFPYLYLQYRTAQAAATYGNTTYFYKPSNFITETYVEQGILGIITITAILFAVVYTYIKASSKSSLTQEAVIITALTAMLLVLPSTLITLIVLFVTLAAYFDKVESLPEMLPAIRAIDIKESLYTNRTISRGNLLLLVVSIVGAIAFAVSTIQPTITMLAYSRALQRVTAAQNAKNPTNKETADTLMNAYNTSNAALKYCKDCSQLNYLNVNILLSLQTLYNNSLSDADKATSTDLRQVKNLLLQSVTDLIAKNPSRYEYWLSVAQAYRTFADEEKATSFYVLSVQSVSNALAVNTLSIDANYLYIDVLLSLGNDATVNGSIASRVSTLRQIVGTPVQEQMIEGILAARLGKYDDSLTIFNKIKSDVTAMTVLTDDQKKQIVTVVDQRIEEVKKLKASGTTTPTPVATVTPTPTVSATVSPPPIK